ncbi:hypothetical protein PMm318_A28110 [Pseudomonas moorei]
MTRAVPWDWTEFMTELLGMQRKGERLNCQSVSTRTDFIILIIPIINDRCNFKCIDERHHLPVRARIE